VAHSQHCAITPQGDGKINVCHCSVKRGKLWELLLVHSALYKHLSAAAAAAGLTGAQIKDVDHTQMDPPCLC
jgi:hypothetical protein